MRRQFVSEFVGAVNFLSPRSNLALAFRNCKRRRLGEALRLRFSDGGSGSVPFAGRNQKHDALQHGGDGSQERGTRCRACTSFQSNNEEGADGEEYGGEAEGCADAECGPECTDD